MIADLAKATVKTGKFPYYAKDGKISFALKREYTEAAAKVVSGESYPEVLTLAGKSVTFAEAVDAASGQKLDVYEVTAEAFPTEFKLGEITDLDMALAVNYQNYTLTRNNGEADLTTDDSEKVLGCSLTPIKDTLRE